MHMNKPVYYICMFLAVIFTGCAKETPDYQSTYYRYPVNINKLQNLDVEPPTDSELSSKGLNSGFFLITPYANSVRKYHYYNRLYEKYVDANRGQIIPVKYNERVQYFMDFFLERKRDLFASWLERSQNYIPDMLEILREHNVPDDLVYLPLIESGFNPKAMSPAYAVGQWQFIKPTGKRYGLEINNWVDERMHWEKSTRAAASYLSDLYQMFNSWELALAAYNCGEARVARAVKKHNSNDYWVVSESLPRETRNYVPIYMAALIIAKNPEKYGFNINQNNIRPETTTVNVPPQKSLKKIAEVTGIDHETLSELNPSLISEATPPGSHFELTIPAEHKKIFTAKRADIENIEDIKQHRTRGSYIYTVRHGDSLWEIARRHRVSLSDLRLVNNLRGNTIRKGQRITIPGDNSVRIARKQSPPTFTYTVKPGETLGGIAQKHGVKLRTLKSYNGISGSFIKAGQRLTIPGSSRVISHKIKKGDTLWDIASKYRVKVADIKKWNKLDSTILVVGQDLTIYR